jgi:hypothetical protein
VKELTDLPPGVIGFETAGWVHAADYRDVVRPAVAKAAAEGDLRCVVVLDDFGGLTPAAVWHDLWMGLQHLRTWKRIAVVTDNSWIARMTALFGWATPGDLKRFSLAERADAIAWSAGQPETSFDARPEG